MIAGMNKGVFFNLSVRPKYQLPEQLLSFYLECPLYPELGFN